MKHLAVVLAIAAAACATGSQESGKEPRTLPDVQLVELVGPNDVQLNGPFDVRYGLQITNPSSQPITLRRVDVTQIGTGAYRLQRNLPVVVNTTIDPGTSTQVAFWLHAYLTVMPGMPGSNEPVNLRVITYYDSPTGSFHRITQAMLGQF